MVLNWREQRRDLKQAASVYPGREKLRSSWTLMEDRKRCWPRSSALRGFVMSTIIKDSEKYFGKSSMGPQRKKMKTALQEDLGENVLFPWFSDTWSQKILVSGPILQEKNSDVCGVSWTSKPASSGCRYSISSKAVSTKMNRIKSEHIAFKWNQENPLIFGKKGFCLKCGRSATLLPLAVTFDDFVNEDNEVPTCHHMSDVEDVENVLQSDEKWMYSIRLQEYAITKIRWMCLVRPRLVHLKPSLFCRSGATTLPPRV